MDDVANAAAGQMAYIGLSLAGQLLLVRRDLFQNKVQEMNIVGGIAWGRSESVVASYSQIPTLLKETS